jgi:CubicO group peptidase (beta-lactamase class C family)
MILVERGQLRLNDTIGKFIPEIEDENANGDGSAASHARFGLSAGLTPGKMTGRDGSVAGAL